MGRSKIPIDPDAVLSLREEGWTLEEIAEELRVGTATLSRRLSYLRHNEGILTKFREFQYLRFTDLTAKLLDSLEDELSELTPEQKIKLLGVLMRAEARYNKDKGQGGLWNLADVIINMEKNGRIEREDIEVENVVDYK